MFKAVNSALVSVKVSPVDPEIPERFKFNAAVEEGTVKLFVKVTVAPPAKLTLLIVKLASEFAVIVAEPVVVLPAVAFKLKPFKVTLVIVPAAVALAPLTSVIETVPV